MLSSKSLRTTSRKSRSRTTIAISLPLASSQLVSREPQPSVAAASATVDPRVPIRKSRSRSLMQRFTQRISAQFPRYKSEDDLERNSAASTMSSDHWDKVAQGYMVRVTSQGGRIRNSSKMSRFSRSCDHLEDVSHDEARSQSSGYHTATDRPPLRSKKPGGVERRLKKTANFLFGSGWNLPASSSNHGWLLANITLKSENVGVDLYVHVCVL
ncbi:hypothetical protein L596_019978 [Steinernema carpocapsae]|uniref:Uncharacterized protein n=1 Tax=Steinernema carpocapsae TaxID=34508 RepID=A0A4U5MS61_STECR|nr:hypothetical protein L596_019978 [Steinernema carpocapsae]